jgi:hypothetical protein
MNAFLELSDSDMVSVDGGVGWMVIGAIALVGVGITVGAGIIIYKGTEGMVGAIQQKQSDGGTSSE